jgi:pyroglutamyl-peptidase
LSTVSILLAYFEAFGGRRRNLSGRVVQQLLDTKGSTWFDEHAIVTRELPVDWSRIGPSLRHCLTPKGLSAVLLLGEARSTRRLGLERIALNVAHSDRQDNGGKSPTLEPLYPGEPLALATELPLAALERSLRARGIPTRISHHAGTFLCNAAYFEALCHARRQGTLDRTLFVHLPGRFTTPKRRENHVERLTRAVETILMSLAR